MLVIEWVYRSSQHDRIDYYTLRACACVCRNWRPIAQRLLFRRVPYPNGEHQGSLSTVYEQLLRALRTSPHLAKHVHYVYLNLWLDMWLGDDIDLGTNSVSLLELCTAVKGIVFARHIHSAARTDALEARLPGRKHWGRESQGNVVFWP